MNKGRRTTIDAVAKAGKFPVTFRYEDPKERREEITSIRPFTAKKGYWMAFSAQGHFLIPMDTIIYVEE